MRSKPRHSMSKSHNLDACESGADFIRVAQCSPNLVKLRWSGDHCTVTGPNGRETLVNSHWEYPPFVRRRIAKAIIAIGLACLLLIPLFINSLT